MSTHLQLMYERILSIDKYWIDFNERPFRLKYTLISRSNIYIGFANKIDENEVYEYMALLSQLLKT